MKLKGISRFEQYADKAVFGLFAVFLLFVLVMQVGLIGGAAVVKVGGKDVPIDQADRAIKEIADAKRAKLESDRVDERIPATVLSAREQFEAALAQTRAPAPKLAALGISSIRGVGLATPVGAEIANADADFKPFTPPAPSRPLVALFEGTIDPISVGQIGEELAKLLPAEQPFDARTVTVLSVFDAASMRAMLSGAEGAGAPIPAAFWQGRVELLDVQVVRQERGSDGQWGADETLSQIPGRFSLRERLSKDDITPLALRSVLDAERGNRESIRRPPMYGTIAGEPWTWPKAPDEGASAKQSQIDRLERELRGVRAEIARLEKQLGDRPGGGPPPPPPPPGGDRGGDRGGNPPTGRPDARDQLVKRLDQFKARETEIVKELTDLGAIPAASTETPNAPGAAMGPERLDETLASLTEAVTEKVTIWAHDFVAQPGAEYRYKVRVTVTNPFFGQADRLKEEQRSLATPVTVYSADSEWSEPVRIQPRSIYFVRSAQDAAQDAIGRQSRATIDIYQFFYGYWRRAGAILQPGDPVVATTEELPAMETWRIAKDAEGKWVAADPTPVERRRTFSADMFLLDVLSIVGGEKGAAMAFLATAAGDIVTMRADPSPLAAAIRARLDDSVTQGQKAVVRAPAGEPSLGGSSSGVPGAPGGPGGPGGPPGTPPAGGPPSTPTRDRE